MFKEMIVCVTGVASAIVEIVHPGCSLSESTTCELRDEPTPTPIERPLKVKEAD